MPESEDLPFTTDVFHYERWWDTGDSVCSALPEMVAGKQEAAVSAICFGCLKEKGESMNRKEKKTVLAAAVFAAAFGIAPGANAMHIMEGYLPAGYCIAWGVLCIPFLLAGFYTIRRRLRADRRSITLLAMSGAFIFVISSLKIPSVTGSCSHMTGTGLGAILFGPAPVSILGVIVLVFQAVLLAHGGLTSLGANTFSMAIAGPVLSYGIYAVCKRWGVNKRVSVFLAASLGDLFTYCVTSVQLALAFPAPEGGAALSAVKFLGVFAPTQIPLAVVEGILTVIIVIGLEVYAQPELRTLETEKGAGV